MIKHNLVLAIGFTLTFVISAIFLVYGYFVGGLRYMDIGFTLFLGLVFVMAVTLWSGDIHTTH